MILDIGLRVTVDEKINISDTQICYKHEKQNDFRLGTMMCKLINISRYQTSQVQFLSGEN